MTAAPRTAGTVTSADGTAIACEQRGQGPPVVLVGGALNDRSASAVLAAQLAPDFTAWTYDRRGRGESGDTAPYAVEREIEDLAAVIAQAGGEAFVYGVSSGAVLAFEAAAAGLPIRAVALFEPPYVPSEGSGGFSARLAGLIGAGRRGDAVALFMRTAGLPEEAVAGARDSPMWPGLEAMAHTLVYDTALAGDGTLPAGRMLRVSVPALVLDSDASAAALRRAARETATALPAGQHRSVPGRFHEVPAEDLAPVLTEFFTEPVSFG